MAPPEADRHAAADLLSVFAVLWAGAAAWHVVGNPQGAPDWVGVLLAVAIGLVLCWPGQVLPLVGLAVATIVSIWAEAPVLGNHWLLAGFVGLALVAAVAFVAVRDRRADREAIAGAFLPAARLCLVGFYGFAGFAKLNAAFFDRQVSCAVFYFNESTDSLGLAALQLDGAPWLQTTVIWATAAIELSIPPLLLWRRTRHAAVVLAIAFHALLALDRAHEFFDFSSVLLALFVLFLPDGFGTWVVERARRLPLVAHAALVALGTLSVLLAVGGDLTQADGTRWGWWPWQAAVVAVLVAIVLYLRTSPEPRPTTVRPVHLVLLGVPILVVVNGLTPYLELKTAYGWNMYANLRTIDGDSNHFLVRATLPLGGEDAEVVRIVSSSDPVLAGYADQGYGLTWRQLRAYLADRPDTAITFERDGEVVVLARAGDDPALVRPVPTWQEKLLLFRAVDLQSPERCVPTFGPAR